MEKKVIGTNKKAFRDFVLTESWECGIELQGCEVKSIRGGCVNFKDSFARVEKEEVFLYSLYIDPYPQASYMNPEPDRIRRLLLNKKEIKRLIGKSAEQHLTLVPTKIYINKRGYVKIEIALGKGKKHFDKRETIKKRQIDRELSRAIKSRS